MDLDAQDVAPVTIPVDDPQLSPYIAGAPEIVNPWSESFARLKSDVKPKPEELMTNCGMAIDHKKEVDVEMRRGYQQHLYHLRQQELHMRRMQDEQMRRQQEEQMRRTQEEQMRRKQMQEHFDILNNQVNNTSGYTQTQGAQSVPVVHEYANQAVGYQTPYVDASSSVAYDPFLTRQSFPPHPGLRYQPIQPRLTSETNLSLVHREAAFCKSEYVDDYDFSEKKGQAGTLQERPDSTMMQARDLPTAPGHVVQYNFVQANAGANSTGLGSVNMARMSQAGSVHEPRQYSMSDWMKPNVCRRAEAAPISPQANIVAQHSRQRVSESSDAPSAIFSEGNGSSGGQLNGASMLVTKSSPPTDHLKGTSTPPTDMDETPTGPQMQMKDSPTLSDLIGSETPSDSSSTETSDVEFNPHSPSPHPRSRMQAKRQAHQARRANLRVKR